jgi:hypothetical protein
VNPRLEQQWLRVAARLGNDKARRIMSSELSRISYQELELRARLQSRLIEEDKNIEVYLPTDEYNNCYNPSCDRTDTTDARFQTCSKCKSVKYCSRDCQVAHWKERHKSECKNLIKHKEEYKERGREENRRCLENLSVMLVDQCYFCKKEADETTTLMQCSKCKVPKYCSTDCQVSHWKSGGHKTACAKAVAEFMEAQEILDRAK